MTSINDPAFSAVPFPITQSRYYVSVIDSITGRFVKISQKLQTQYPQQISIKRVDALKTIEKAIQSAQAHLIKLSAEEALKAKTTLIEAKNQCVSDLSNSLSNTQTCQKMINIFLKWLELTLLENPHYIKCPPFSLNENDFLAAQANYNTYVATGRMMQCQDFAFFVLQEERALPFILETEIYSWPMKLVLNPVEFLASWDYELTSEPLPGDLVIYWSSLQGFLEVKHLGIWTKNEKVLSKHGSGEVWEHPLSEVLLGYGNFVYFFHKKIKSPMLKEFIKETTSVSEAVTTFSHSACHSPLSALGCMRVIARIFKRFKVKSKFKSTYLEYHAELKFKLLAKIKLLSPAHSFTEALEKLNETIHAQAKEQPPLVEREWQHLIL